MLASHLFLRRAGALLLAGLLAVFSLPMAAQDWPNRPIKLIVPHSPGGATDAVARLVAQPLGDALGQSIVVDNKPGAGGILGTDLAAQAPADGYTLLMLVDANTVYPSTKIKLNHDPAASFAPISLIGRGSHVLVLHPSVPAKNLQELIAYVRANPGQLACALPGANSPQHLALEMIKAHAKLDITPIPYKGGGQAITDIVGGQVKFGVLGMAPAVPHIKAGRLKAIAVTGSTRSGALPDVPTVAESGIPGFETNQWQSMVAPAGTPPAIVNRLSAEVDKILKKPEVIERFKGLGAEPVGGTPEQLGQFIAAETGKWSKVVRESGAKID